ncbi:MAG: hypothetical protein LAO30_23465 [Acidobacteriia bacterium]|nr:hypothetical protein [Terriglobia bacterium]
MKPAATAAVVARELSGILDWLTRDPVTACASIQRELVEYLGLLRRYARLTPSQLRRVNELGDLILLALRVDGAALAMDRAKWDVDERDRRDHRISRWVN